MRWKSIFYFIIFICGISVVYGDESLNLYNRFNPYASTYNALGALENPSILGYLDDRQFTLFYNESISMGSKNIGSVIEFGNFGFGVSYFDSSDVEFLRYSIPLGFRAGDYMLMGLGLSLFDPVKPEYGFAWDWYAGAIFIPARFLNISVFGQHLGQPSVQGIPLKRRVNLGVGLKPFSELLELYGDFSFVEHGVDPANRYLIALNPFSGMRIFFGITGDKDMYGGINLDFTRFGASFMGNYSGEKSGYDGKGFAIRYSKKHYDELLTLSKQVILIRLDNTVKDGVEEDIFGLKKKSRSAVDIIRDIKYAAKDSGVAGMILYIGDIHLSLSVIEEIREAVRYFRESGKKVLVFLESGDDISYFLATIGDRIVMNEGGSLYLKGASSQMLYFKNFFEKIGLRFDVVAAGEYKTAFEPLVESKASERRKEQTKKIIESLQGIINDSISEGRGLGRAQLEKVYDISLFSPEKAMDMHLVDEIGTFERVRNNVEYYFGKPYFIKEDYVRASVLNNVWQLPKRVAIIYLNGDIVYGRAYGDSLGVETIGNLNVSEMAKEIIADENIAGVIVRINSPGGSTIASQLIFEELSRIKAHKPLVVSIGSMGASGGYLSAISGDYIIADRTSLVGSIGVFFLKPDFSGLLKKLEINYESQNVAHSGDSDSLFRGLKEYEIKSIRDYIDSFYSYFKEKVAKSRKMDKYRVSELAEGKVYSGIEAKQKGLVDDIGGYIKACEKIRSMAKIPEDVEIEFVEFYPRRDLGSMILSNETIINDIIRTVFKNRDMIEFVQYRYFE